ncbi:hypothetical protein D3C72_1845180 [compost metagenome]
MPVLPSVWCRFCSRNCRRARFEARQWRTERGIRWVVTFGRRNTRHSTMKMAHCTISRLCMVSQPVR